MKNIFRYCVLIFCSITACKSQVGRTENCSGKIVIINAGVSTRLGIYKELQKINEFNPKVVGIDFQFSELKIPYQDSLLASELNMCKNLIMIGVLQDYDGEDKVYSSLSGSLPMFLSNAEIGFANALLEDDEFQTLKRFSAYEKFNDTTIYHVAVKIAHKYNSMKSLAFLGRNRKTIDVQYCGGEESFKVFSHDDVMSGEVKREDIEGKIVLIGYLGPYEGYVGRPLVQQDKYFSPLNNWHQPYEPDMYGVIYIANIINQILNS